MNTGLPLLIIGLVFGGGIGFTIAAANGITLDGHDHGSHGAAGHGDMDHEAILALPASDTAPTLAIAVSEDSVAGYNLHIMTENFTFSPQNAGLAHVAGEGHGHVYINGVKLGRVYGPWVHLDHLPEGEVTIDVTLNANDHRALAVSDTPLRASITIEN